MFVMSSYTTGCHPVYPNIKHEKLADIKKAAVERLAHIRHRAFSAGITDEIVGHEHEYDHLENEIKAATAKTIGSKKVFGPLHDGYNIEIANIG